MTLKPPFLSKWERDRPKAVALRCEFDSKAEDGHFWRWYLTGPDGPIARVYNVVRDESGKWKIVGAERASHRIFVTPDGVNHVYEFAKRERREMSGREGTVIRQMEKAQVGTLNARRVTALSDDDGTLTRGAAPGTG